MTVATSDEILAVHVLSADRVEWDALSDNDKAVQISKAQELVQAGLWNGVPVDSAQEFVFPRIDEDGNYLGRSVTDQSLPADDILAAIALMAWHMTDNVGAWSRLENRTAGHMAGQAVSGVSVSYTASNLTFIQQQLQLCPFAWQRLKKYWRNTAVIV